MKPNVAFEEQFFARQRDEILARVAAGEALRRTRRRLLPLVATLLLGALAAGGLALRGPPSAATSADWLFAWDLPAQVAVADPLASDDWSLAADDSEIEPDLLPPLFEDAATLS